MRKIGLLILLLVIILPFLYLGLKTQVLFKSLKENNNLIKNQLNQKDIKWLDFNWEELDKNIINLDSYQRKVANLIPGIKSEVQFQDNIKEVISFNKDLKSGVLAKNIINNNQDYLNQVLKINDLQNYFQNYNLIVLNDFFKDFNIWYQILGFDKPKNYLLLYQVPLIARPTGGLMTGYSIFTFNKGLESVNFDDILSLDDLVLTKYIPPEPLRILNNRWLFHDLNWFFDYPHSAKKIIDWYNQTGSSPSLDGVIMVNTSLIQNLINNLNIDKFQNISINDVFLKGLTSSMNYTGLETNKEVLITLMNTLFNEIKNTSSDKLLSLQKQLASDIVNKDFEIYFEDDRLEYYFDNLNLTGKISNSQNDYLAVVFNNLSPTFKIDDSSKNISLTTDFSTTTITNTLIIKEEKKPLNPESYLKIYLPLNSKIIKTEGIYLKDIPNKINYQKLGYVEDSDISQIEKNKIKDVINQIEIYQEEDKTVIGFWAKPSIKPIKIVYQLPQSSSEISKWQLVIQKQSGSNQKINYNIVLPQNKKLKPTAFQFNKPFILTNNIEVNFEFE